MKEFKLDKIKATGTTVGDVHFPKVKLLLPFDGSNGATTTTDSSNSNLSLTIQGSTVISTAQSKFGGSSLYVTNSSSEGVYASAAGSTINLTGDFTVEYWFRRVQVTLADNMVLGPLYGADSTTNPTGYGGLLIGYYYSAVSTSQALLYSSSNGSSWNVAQNVQMGTGSLGTVGQWVHMALVRSGTTWSYYVDGTRTYTGTLGSATLATPGSYIVLGKSWGSGTNNAEGYYDDFRITQGLARYSGASFTPPTTAHLTSAGDVNKHIVVNSGADGVAIGTGGINQARIAKAWVNFNGTSTVAIRSSYNVSSITDNGTGDYTANLSTALSDTNGAAVAMTGYVDHTWGIPLYKDVSGSNPLTTTQFRVATVEPETTSVTYYDQEQVSILIFGN